MNDWTGPREKDRNARSPSSGQRETFEREAGSVLISIGLGISIGLPSDPFPEEERVRPARDDKKQEQMGRYSERHQDLNAQETRCVGDHGKSLPAPGTREPTGGHSQDARGTQASRSRPHIQTCGPL